MPWFNNTIFIFTADHSAESNRDINKTKLGRFSIPVFMYAPSTYLKGESKEYFQYIDITPTVLGLLGIKKSIISFGNDAFDTEKKFVVNYINNLYQIAYGDYFLLFDGEKSIAFYDLVNDPLMASNIITELNSDELIQKDEAENLLKGIIQQYNNRLINNHLSTSSN